MMGSSSCGGELAHEANTPIIPGSGHVLGDAYDKLLKPVLITSGQQLLKLVFDTYRAAAD